MTRSGQRVVLNVNVLDVGVAPGAWTLGDVDAHSFVDLDHFVNVARIAERGALDAFFLADGPGFWENPRIKPTRALEPSVILAAVAADTERIGLIGTASTTFNDPYDLAERFLSLDYISGGRAAWNIVTTYSPTAAANFGFDHIPDRDHRYRRAKEFVTVVEGLWESARTRRALSHHGEFFDIDTLLRVPPSAQGRPPLIQAGGSPAGRELAGRTAHGVFSAELTLDSARRHYRHVKDVARAAGRNPADVKILPGLITVIGSTEAEAIARHEALRTHVPPRFGWDRLGLTLGVPVSDLELDEPIPPSLLDGPPDVANFAGSLGFRESVVGLARERNLTLAQLLRELDGGGGHRTVIGTPEQVADTIEEWFHAEAADGFNLMPDAFPSGLETFVDEVVPLLRRRGLFRDHYEEDTLRDRLGVPLPGVPVARSA